MATTSEQQAAPRARYRKIEVRMWGDEKFRALSPLQPSAQALWVFLLTGPHTGPIPGLFRAGRAALAEELDWPVEAFDEAFREVFREGMAKADWKAKVVWIPNALKCNKPESPNVVKSWASEWSQIPECALKREAFESLKANTCALSEAFGKAFAEAFGMASGKASGKACGNQEQEQEQEQEQDNSGDPAGSPAGSKTASLQKPACPHSEIVELYHEILPMCPSIRDWTKARQTNLRARWNEEAKRQNLDYWQRFFTYIAESDFLTGRSKTQEGRKPFVASLDWIVKPENFTKIREGRYHHEDASA
ncbi:hypothetical protein A2G96_05720 [Cupriavidus nantongensis]|uniref:Uncharacterized protein n=2 Tax=Cupriavidus nantongensis TaxID=1796606 RepID=A0A142JQ65_9BURK|nr:hypothetical protein A2G96_05720 [Cupriavidus nantongensis]